MASVSGTVYIHTQLAKTTDRMTIYVHWHLRIIRIDRDQSIGKQIMYSALGCVVE